MPDARHTTHSRNVAFSPHAQPLGRADAAVPPQGARVSFRLPAADTSASEARRRTRRQLADWRAPEETQENALLVMSELVTNALRHTSSTSVGCELRMLGTLLRVEVAGDGRGPVAPAAAAAEDDESGRGLFLVCALSERWGVRPADSGRGHVVWADLAFP